MICKLILLSLMATSVALGSAIKGSRDELAIKGERPGLPQWEPARSQLQQVEQQREIPKLKDQDRVEQQQPQRELSKTQDREEQHREPSKTSANDYEFQHREEQQLQQKEFPEQQRLEEINQQREEAPLQLIQQKEESLSQVQQQPLRYEAKPQVQKLEQAYKGQRLEEPAAALSQQQEVRYETKSLAEPTRDATPKGAPRREELKSEAQHQKLEELAQQRIVEEQTRVEAAAPAPFEQQQQQRELNYESQQQQQVVELRDHEQRRLEDQQLTQVQLQQHQEEERTYGTKGAASASAVQAPVGEPEPYAFDYSVEGSSRRESGDTKGVVRGQYTLQNPDGSARIVDYIADRDGFRATVNTNEFGTESGSPAGIEIRSSQPAAQDISLRLEGKTRESLSPSVVAAVGTKTLAAAPVPAKPENWSVKGASASAAAALAAPVQQREVVAYAEESRATKGAPTKGLLEQAPLVQQFEVKSIPVALPAPLPLVAAAPAKGSRVEVAPEPAAKEQQPQFERKSSQELGPAKSEQIELAAPAPAKSAELRTPKAIGASLRPAAVRTRAGFESATAHRQVIGVPRQQHQVVSSAHYQRPAPVTRSYVQAQPVGVLRTHYGLPQPAASVLRSRLQHDRYPPSPVHHRNERPVVANPRVSFYSNNVETISDELPAGFEASS